MREGWREETLGALITQRKDFTPVAPDEEYVILGVQRSGWGFVERQPIKGGDQKFAKLMQLDKDDLVYRTITAFEAPSAVVGSEQVGRFVTPQTFPVFKINARRLLPGFMALLTTWPMFHEEMASRCTGSVLRRKTLSVGAFRSIPIALPPLAEQQRIVDLIGAVDDAIEKADAAAKALGDGAVRMRDVIPCGEPLAMTELVKAIHSGVSTKPVSGEGPRVNLLTLAAIRPARFHPGEIKDVGAAHLPEVARVREGDVLITRSNTPDRVGYVAIANGVLPDTFLPDLVWRLVVNESRVSREYLVEVLSSPTMRGRIMAIAKGTSQSMQKINRANFGALTIPVPGPDAQSGYVEPIMALSEACKAVEAEAQHLRTLRSNLLTALLSGEHQIPESYDELMEVAP